MFTCIVNIYTRCINNTAFKHFIYVCHIAYGLKPVLSKRSFVTKWLVWCNDSYNTIQVKLELLELHFVSLPEIVNSNTCISLTYLISGVEI